MNYEFKKGDTIFNLQGEAAEAVMPHPDQSGWMVHPFYEAHEGEDTYTERGPLTHWPKVYAEPPVEVKNQTIIELDAKIAEKREELRVMGSTRYQIQIHEKEDKKRLEKLAMRSAALTRLEDFLDGKITHYVKTETWDSQNEIGRKWDITEVEKERCGDDGYDRRLKLLTLFGSSDGNLEYRLNRYSDGSGSSSNLVYPCCSLEEAQRVAREKVLRQLEVWTAEPEKFKHLVDVIIRNLKNFEMEVPEFIRLAALEQTLAGKREALKKANEAAAKALDELEKLEETQVI